MYFPIKSLCEALDNKDVTVFNDMLHAVKDSGFARKEVVPFATASESAGKLVVYPNLMLNVKPSVKIKTPKNIYHYKTRIAPIVKSFKQDIKVPKIRENKWGRDPFRTFNIAQEVAITKYVRELLEGTITDHELRDLSAVIEYNITHRHNVNIVYAETPEDYVEMHKAGVSCMATPNVDKTTYDHYGDESARYQIFRELGLWPSHFYSFCPQIQGVYVKNKGAATARAFIFNNHYGSLYGGVGCGTLTEHLRKEGVKYGAGGRIKIKEAFEIPAVTWRGQKLCPVPTCDNLAHGYYVTYDEARDVFIVGPTGDHLMEYSYSYKGWISSKGKPVHA